MNFPTPRANIHHPQHQIRANPLPILQNQRHELFAQALAKGNSAAAAFVIAGYKENRHNASRLSTKETVIARVGELLNASAELAVIDKAWIMSKLALNVELAMAREADGKPKATFSGSVAARSLHLLGLEHGMFKEKIELGGKVQVANRELFEKLTPAERVTMRAMLVAAATRQAAANENRAEDGDEDQVEQATA